MNLREIILRPVIACEEARFRALLDTHHYLGSLPKIGYTLWYVATWQDRWLGLLSGGLGWLLALVWAKYKPGVSTSELEQRIAALEAELEQREVKA